jgi:hypothetical protein
MKKGGVLPGCGSKPDPHPKSNQMFTRTSKYNKLKAEKRQAEIKFENLRLKWNQLVERLNRFGGLTALETAAKNPPQFSKDEIKKLIALCHPDKHANSPISNEITARLLKMR